MKSMVKSIIFIMISLALCLATTNSLAAGTNPTDPPLPEPPVPTEPAVEPASPADENPGEVQPIPPFGPPEEQAFEPAIETAQPVEGASPPWPPDQAPAPAGEQRAQQSADPIEAVVVRSWGGCSSGSLVWDDLNANWASYGTTPIHINYSYAGLCSGTITYAALVASGADVLILSDPTGGAQVYSAAEIAAIQQYAEAGHHLLGTYILLQGGGIDNRGLAPLFGLQPGLTYTYTDLPTPTYSYIEPGNPLFRRLGATFPSSGFNYTQVPESGTWTAAVLNGARMVGISADQKAAIFSYHGSNYHATFITNFVEYGGGAYDKQFIYNALTYDVIDAVVIRSWNGCHDSSVIWDNLNADWTSYGSVPIHFRYAAPGLCSGTITYPALVASKADMLIISDPAGGNQQYSPAEIAAIQQYAQEGHNLVGTYLLLQNAGIDNRSLAPLFGLQAGLTYTNIDVTPTYSLLETANPLFKRLTAPYASAGFQKSMVPASGTWTKAALNGARIVGANANRTAVITAFDAPHYRALYISNMPEYLGGAADMQFFYNAVRYAIDAVVVRPWGNCTGVSDFWEALNSNSVTYGSYPVRVEHAYHGLCDGTVAYAALAASKADVLILSNPGGWSQQYSPAEISAIQQYAQEGHHLVGTYLLLQYSSIDNRGLAPLFGLQAGVTYGMTPSAITPTYSYLEPANPLFRQLGATYASNGYIFSQVPASGTWTAAALNGARIAAINADQKAAVLSYHGPNYHATYITSMPEFNGGDADRRFLYNAITYDVINAVVVRSWSGCNSGSVIWDSLNATWPTYGELPIHVRYAAPGLCTGTISYAALAASKADVLILSDPAGASLQYSPAEIAAIQQYAREGHHLIGTLALFQYAPTDNRGLAPLFGLQAGLTYTGSEPVSATYSYLEPANVLFKRIPPPYVSVYQGSQYPASGTWTAAALNGARFIGINADRRAAIFVYTASTYHAIYISSMPEYGGGTADRQFFYNAIAYQLKNFLPAILK